MFVLFTKGESLSLIPHGNISSTWFTVSKNRVYDNKTKAVVQDPLTTISVVHSCAFYPFQFCSSSEATLNSFSMHTLTALIQTSLCKQLVLVPYIQ